MKPLDDAIQLAASDPSIAYPTIAVNAKIEALEGLRQFAPALKLADEALKRLDGGPFDGQRSQYYATRGAIYRDQQNWSDSIRDYEQAVAISQRIGNYRGITDAAGELAREYEHMGNLPTALTAINAAIEANAHIPNELYLAPRNLATKAEITSKLGRIAESDALYRKSMTLVDVMVQHAPTSDVQRQLLSEMSDAYSGYFASLSAQKRYEEALQTLEQIHGRVETDALEHHPWKGMHAPTAEEQRLTQLNIGLINTDNPAQRAAITNAIYSTELRVDPGSLAEAAIDHPVRLKALQGSLSPSALLVEYVLSEPVSYAYAVTRDSVIAYALPSKFVIEADAKQYRDRLLLRQTDVLLAKRLFAELLAPVSGYDHHSDLVIVPDGILHLLPFSALVDEKGYLIQSHAVDVSPSSTAYALLNRKATIRKAVSIPYIGVAAWTRPIDARNPVLRALTDPQRSKLVPLPESKKEVETIAGELPQPSVVLLGPDATESRFKQLSLATSDVIHLALHGYVDLEYPDRSELIFAPESSGSANDGLLKIREIRRLHLNAKLVTLSACNTGVGPVGAAGAANLVNAFIEAGAETVVSNLWELEDQATEHLMTDFYGRLAQHTRKVDGLRLAQLELLDGGYAPYYWAGFQIVGDPNGTIE